MSRVGNASSPAYNAVADLAHVERELITVMYSLGMNTETISSSSFDEIVAGIKSTFPFIRLEQGHTLASNDALKEINVLLMVNVRRLWHRWQLAESIVNG
jgi:hypothetical protein